MVARKYAVTRHNVSRGYPLSRFNRVRKWHPGWVDVRCVMCSDAVALWYWPRRVRLLSHATPVLVHGIAWARCSTSLGCSVGHVLCSSAEEEMFGVDTQGVVALVKHAEMVRDRAPREYPCDAVRAHHGRSASAGDQSSVGWTAGGGSSGASCPKPARRCDANLRPKAIR
jgi:hypothetical protein